MQNDPNIVTKQAGNKGFKNNHNTITIPNCIHTQEKIRDTRLSKP